MNNQERILAIIAGMGLIITSIFINSLGILDYIALFCGLGLLGVVFFDVLFVIKEMKKNKIK